MALPISHKIINRSRKIQFLFLLFLVKPKLRDQVVNRSGGVGGEEWVDLPFCFVLSMHLPCSPWG